MATQTNTQLVKRSQTWRAWFNGIGILIAVIGLFWKPDWLGSIGGILGIIGVSGAHTPADKTWGWVTILVGAAVLILGLSGATFAAQ